MNTITRYAFAAAAMLFGTGTSFSQQLQPLTAAEAKTVAEEGAAFARAAATKAPEPRISDDGERVTLPGEGDIEIRDLVPGSTRRDARDLEALAGDADALARAAEAHRREQEQASTPEADAYRVLRNAPIREVTTIEQDGYLWRQTPGALATASLSRDFADCSAETRYVPEDGAPVHVSREAICERLGVLDRCERHREIEDYSRQGVSVHHVESMIDSDVVVPFEIADDLPADVFILDASASLTFSGSIADARFTEIPSEANGWTGAVALVFDESRAVCKLADGATCVRGSQDCACEPQHAAVEITADVTAIKERLVGECLLETDGFCHAKWTCTDDAPRAIGGSPVPARVAADLADLYPASSRHSPASSKAPLCYRAQAQYECPFNIGSMGCWDTPGGRQCHENTGADVRADTCAALARRSECTLKRRTCNENARGYLDFCYVATETYDCREPVEIRQFRAVTTNTCLGNLRCMGSECVVPAADQEPGASFAQAQAAGALIQHLTHDYAIDPGTGKPVVLAGVPMECRKATGGTLDTCRETSTPGPQEWAARYGAELKRGDATAALHRYASGGEPEVGAWSRLDRDAGQGILDEAITSKIESVTAGAASSPGGSSTVADVTNDYAADARERWMRDSDWIGTESEWMLGNLREVGNCAHIGAYCSNAHGPACVETRDVFCCFASPMSRMLREQLAGPQGIEAGAFGSPTQPRCGGVPREELNQLVANAKLDEWIGRMKLAGALVDDDPAALDARYSLERLTGSGSALAENGERPDARQRTQARLASADAHGAHASIRAQLQAGRSAPTGTPLASSGEFELSPNFNYAVSGHTAGITVSRSGGNGAASVELVVLDDTARAGRDYDSVRARLAWGHGETGVRTVNVPTRPGATARLRARLELRAPTGAVLGPAATGILDILPGAAYAGPPPSDDPAPPLDCGAAAAEHGLSRVEQLTTYTDGVGTEARDATTLRGLHGGKINTRKFHWALRAGSYVALAFTGAELQADTDRSGYSPGGEPQISRPPFVGFATITISRCPGDFRWSAEADGQLCRGTSRASVNDIISFDIGDAGARHAQLEHVCTIDRNATYFLNVVFADARDGLTQDENHCPRGAASCGWRWNIE